MITITEAAADHIKASMKKRGMGLGIRLAVHKTGCSGYAYQVDFCDNISEKDSVTSYLNAVVIVAKDLLPILDGLEIDYVKEGFAEGFTFKNPNESSRCGCGESFTTKA